MIFQSFIYIYTLMIQFYTFIHGLSLDLELSLCPVHIHIQPSLLNLLGLYSTTSLLNHPPNLLSGNPESFSNQVFYKHRSMASYRT